MELLAVEDNRQSGVEEHVILQQTLDIFVFILVILEYLFVRDEIGERPVCLLRRADRGFLRDDCLVVFYPLAFAVPVTGDQEIAAQRIYGFDSDSVQSDRLFESLAIVLCSVIHLAGDIDYLAQRNAAALVAYGDGAFFDGHFYGFTVTHHIFVDGVIQHLFQQYINTVIGITTVS